MCAAVDSGCNENAQLMCELPNYGRVLVATEVMALWLRSGDGRTLRTHAPLAMERRTIHSGLSFGREESRGIVTGRSPTTKLGGISRIADGKAPAQFSVRLRIHSRLVVTR